MEEIISLFFEQGGEYLLSLDWRYIITLILFVELLCVFVPSDKEFWGWKFKAQYRVILFGFLFAAFFFWLDDKPERKEVLIMFQSMIAAIAIHTWLLKYIVRGIKSKVSGQKIL